jgi:hypothetical protein
VELLVVMVVMVASTAQVEGAVVWVGQIKVPKLALVATVQMEFA